MGGFFWLASYPKSGNTWVRYALAALRQGAADVDFSRKLDFSVIAGGTRLFEDALGVDASDLELPEITDLRPLAYEVHAREAQAPTFAKVHDAYLRGPAGELLFPPSATLGAVVVVRDPRDVAVSLARFTGRTLDAAIALMARPQSLDRVIKPYYGAFPYTLDHWSAHVEGWLGAQGAKPPLLVRYEDLLADTAAEIARMADYVGIPHSPAGIAAAVEATRFERLRAAEQRQGFRERPAFAREFFRAGRAGGWREVLEPRQAALIEAEHGAMMRRLGYPAAEGLGNEPS